MSAPAPIVKLDRPKYQPSGRIFVPGFLLSAMVMFVVALIMGALLAASGHLFYLMIVSPLVAAAVMALPGYFLLRASHCRSAALGALLLGSLGIVVYLFQFPVEQIRFDGPLILLRVDLWPLVIMHMVNNWQIGEVGQNNANPVPVFNWIFFAVELFLCALIPGLIGGTVAAAGYCERCGKWMTKKNAQVEPGAAVDAVQAIAIGKLDGLQPISGNKAGPDHATFTIEGCSHRGADHEATFYLTAAEVRGQGDKMQVTSLAQQALLTPDEFVLLIEKCPQLAVG